MKEKVEPSNTIRRDHFKNGHTGSNIQQSLSTRDLYDFTDAKASKEHELQQNAYLKQKMDNIQEEVSKFSENIDYFSLMCDEELQ